MITPVCEQLGIEQPIVQAPMAAIPELAAAVSNAGALGMVTLTWSDDVPAPGTRPGARRTPSGRGRATSSRTSPPARPSSATSRPRR